MPVRPHPLEKPIRHPSVLGDPMDRLLVATARQLNATFVTADRAILAYARGGHVRVHDASR